MTLVSKLKELHQFAEKIDLPDCLERIENTLNRVENDAFSIAVVGGFKCGKSTFINALLGQTVLPSDVLPATATLNRVTYGLEPLAKLIFKDGREEEVAIKELVDYVTKITPDSEYVASTIKEAIIYYPTPYCRYNIDIIDTPGLFDNSAMDALTISVLPYVDAVIFIVIAQAPLSNSEAQFIESELLKQDLSRIIFLINAIDLLPHHEDSIILIKTVEERIKKYVTDQVTQQSGIHLNNLKALVRKINQPLVFGISAYQALKGKQNNDTELLKQSRFSELESALNTILTQERGKISLQVLATRVGKIATTIMEALGKEEKTLNDYKTTTGKNYNACIKEITALRESKDVEMVRILSALKRVQSQVQTQLDLLEHELKKTIIHVVDSTLIIRSEIKDSNLSNLKKKFEDALSIALKDFLVNKLEKLQKEVVGCGKQISDSLRKSAYTIHDTIGEKIKIVQCAGKSVDTKGIQSKAAGFLQRTNQICETLAKQNEGLPWFESWLPQMSISSNVNGSDREKYQKKFAFPALMVGSLVGGPLGGFIGGLLGGLLGTAIDKVTSSSKKIKILKYTFRNSALAAIDHHLKVNLFQPISQNFEKMYQIIEETNQELEGMLDATQTTFAESYGKDKAIIQIRFQDLKKMRSETQSIFNTTQDLSNQLAQL